MADYHSSSVTKQKGFEHLHFHLILKSVCRCVAGQRDKRNEDLDLKWFGQFGHLRSTSDH